MGIKLREKSKFLPKNKDVRNLLYKIGYWDYFNIHVGSTNLKVRAVMSYV
jgi:hypothetical protein